MIHLTKDELGNTYVDKKGIFWEICDYKGYHVIRHPVGYSDEHIYEAVSESGNVKICVKENGVFVKKNEDNLDSYSYHTDGQLCLKIEKRKEIYLRRTWKETIMNNIYFNVYGEEDNLYILVGFKDEDGNINLLEGHEDEYEYVSDYIFENFESFGELFECCYHKETEIPTSKVKKELKNICDKLIKDGFKFSDVVGRLGYEQCFVDDNDKIPHQIFTQDDFK
jgi:hypothetical protein